jgi:hypothetical protein
VDVRVRVENRSTATTEYGSYDWVPRTTFTVSLPGTATPVLTGR